MKEYIDKQIILDKCQRLIDVERKQGSDVMNYGRERVNQTEVIMEYIEYMTPAADVIEIPKGATNGDMFEAMFPDIKIHKHEKTDICDAYIQIDIWDFSICVSEDWWNAPYKEK